MARRVNGVFAGFMSAVCLLLTFAVAIPSAARDHRMIVSSYEPLRPVRKPDHVMIDTDAPAGHIVVKYNRSVSGSSRSERLTAAGGVRVAEVIRQTGLASLTPMITEEPWMIRARREAAEDRARMNLPDMALYYRTAIDSPTLAMDVIARLNALDEVEIAFFEPIPEVAVRTSVTPAPSMASTPFNWELSEMYLEEAPGGVDARASWTLAGGTGTDIQIIDIEYGWQLTHEDLSAGSTAVIIGVNTTDNDHGTAVLGEMVADRNGFGMTGIVYDADIGISSVWTMSTASALTQATAASDPGDLLLIELHAPGPHYNFQSRDDQKGYIAMEYWQVNFDAIVNAYAAGVIVCEAAGNGAENFDDPMYDSLFTREYRNSHAIICGAGYPPSFGNLDRSKLDFSNYGTRVDLQGYGTGVYTLGYGDLYAGGNKDSWYTDSFGGTSSASPIVTGAVAALSGVYKNMWGRTLDADTARDLLVATGSPQQNPYLAWKIGPRPNLKPVMADMFDPVDSIWYGNVELPVGGSVAYPVSLSNSHAVGEIYIPFKMTGPAVIRIDSLTRAPRTADFETINLVFDDSFAGEVAYRMRADAGGGTNPLPPGTGEVGYLWIRASITAQPGQVEIVDSATLGGNTLKLVSLFDDGPPDDFVAGSVTIIASCECIYQADLDGSGAPDAVDLSEIIDIVFFGAPDTTDPICPRSRSDLDCNETSDSVDLSLMIDLVFFGGAGPCDPCAL